MAALYIHIPFCKKICNYCDFYKKCILDNTHLDAYLNALEKEMLFRKDFIGTEPIKTLFFGGGTPTVYSPEDLQRVIDKAHSIWDLSEIVEISVEMNPDDISEDYLERLAKTDINRLSFGVQSFNDRDLEFLGRRHNSTQAINAIKTAREKGFDNISIDLMYGIPGATLQDWMHNITTAVELNLDHISAYSLTIDPDTILGKMVEKGTLIPATDRMAEEQYIFAHNTLSEAGFAHYEISNYAKGIEKRAVHNCSYWCGEKYLGLGPSAHSYDGDQRTFAVSSFDDYMKDVGSDKIYGREILTQTDKYNEYIMVSLRTCCGIKRDTITQLFGISRLLCFEFEAEKFIEKGLLVRDKNAYKIPPEHYMISDSIIRELFIESEE